MPPEPFLSSLPPATAPPTPQNEGLWRRPLAFLKHRAVQWIALASLIGGGLLGLADPVYGLHFAVPGLLLYALIDLGETATWRSQAASRASTAEKAFLALLLLCCSAIYGYRLGDLPPGYHGHELIMVDNLNNYYDGGPYHEHNAHFDADWPSLIFYQGLASSKLLGKNPAAYRLPSVIWSLLAVLTFYFLARSMLSVDTAMVATPLFAINATLLVWTRNFFPGTLLIFGELAALYFLLRAPVGGPRRRLYFIAGGAALSLCLRGYVPGRIIPACFVAWMPFWLLDRDGRRDLKGLGVFWAAFTISIASLAVWYFNGGSGTYWAYVRTMDPSQGSGIAGHLRLLYANFHHYAAYFNLVGDADGPVPFSPLLPPLVGVFFVLGLWMTLRRPFQKDVIILPMLLVAGIAPAALGGTFSHPSGRRSMLVIPIAYLLFAVGLEAVRLHLGRLRKPAIALAGMLFLIPAGYSLWSYFFFNAKDLNYLYNHDYTGYLIRKTAREHRTQKVWISSTRPVGNMLTFWDMNVRTFWEPEDALREPRGKDALLVLDPIYRSALPFLHAALPKSEPESLPNPFLQLKSAQPDAYSPWELFWTLHVDADGWDEVGRLTLRSAQGERPVEPEKAGGIAGPYELSGSVLGPRGGAKVQADFNESSAALQIGERKIAPGRAFYLPGGVSPLLFKASAGSPPFKLTILKGFPTDEVPELVYLPFAWEHGLRLLVHGVDPEQDPLEIRHPYAEYRFGTRFHRDNWSWQFNGVIEWPSDGRFELGAFKRCGLRIWADGREVFCNWPDLPPLSRPLAVRAGQRTRLRIAYTQQMDNNPHRAFQLLWKRPGRSLYVPVPVDALYFD